MLVVWGIFMGVLKLSFKIVPIEKKDLLEINKILIKEIQAGTNLLITCRRLER